MATKTKTMSRTTTKKGSRPAANGENLSAYFKVVFKENPKLLKGRSNDALLERWLADHPGEKEVPQRVKQILSNVKSVLRNKLKRRGRKKAEAQANGLVAPGAPALRKASSGKAVGQALERLEDEIDECMTLAKKLDREGLGAVLVLLRRARNEVVWKLGQ